jgi:hypothetical protein
MPVALYVQMFKPALVEYTPFVPQATLAAAGEAANELNPTPETDRTATTRLTHQSWYETLLRLTDLTVLIIASLALRASLAGAPPEKEMVEPRANSGPLRS